MPADDQSDIDLSELDEEHREPRIRPTEREDRASAWVASERTAWQYVTAMHAAAMGGPRRPIRGIVEDVEDMRARLVREHGAVRAQLIVERDAALRRVAQLERFLDGRWWRFWRWPLAPPVPQSDLEVRDRDRKIERLEERIVDLRRQVAAANADYDERRRRRLRKAGRLSAGASYAVLYARWHGGRWDDGETTEWAAVVTDPQDGSGFRVCTHLHSPGCPRFCRGPFAVDLTHGWSGETAASCIEAALHMRDEMISSGLHLGYGQPDVVDSVIEESGDWSRLQATLRTREWWPGPAFRPRWLLILGGLVGLATAYLAWSPFLRAR